MKGTLNKTFAAVDKELCNIVRLATEKTYLNFQLSDMLASGLALRSVLKKAEHSPNATKEDKQSKKSVNQGICKEQ